VRAPPPTASLYRYGLGERGQPLLQGHAFTEKRDGLGVDACLTEANGHAQRIGARLRDDRQRRRVAEIKVTPIPGVSPDDPPPADPATVRRSVHAASRSFGCCASFVGDSREAEGLSDAFPTADFGSLSAVGRLDSAERFLDPLADALASSVARIVCRGPSVADERPLVILRYVRRRVHRA
jgi:hypothetical protein